MSDQISNSRSKFYEASVGVWIVTTCAVLLFTCLVGYNLLIKKSRAISELSSTNKSFTFSNTKQNNKNNIKNNNNNDSNDTTKLRKRRTSALVSIKRFIRKMDAHYDKNKIHLLVRITSILSELGFLIACVSLIIFSIINAKNIIIKPKHVRIVLIVCFLSYGSAKFMIYLTFLSRLCM